MFKLLLWEVCRAYFKANPLCPTGLRVPLRAALLRPQPDGRSGSLSPEHISMEEDVTLCWVTRLSLNATPSRYLNRIKAFFYYIPPCGFARLHSNYQPCCSTRGFRCSPPLPFYGKLLIPRNPNENTAVRQLSPFILRFPFYRVSHFLYGRETTKYSGLHAFSGRADTPMKGPQSSSIAFPIFFRNT